MDIGTRIRAARARRGMSQSDLARALAKPRQHISQIELGHQMPRPELIVEIAKALNVSSDYLLGLVDDEDERRPRPRRRAAVKG
jgi:transcriptional regulator with XRE-family HTH domain